MHDEYDYDNDFRWRVFCAVSQRANPRAVEFHQWILARWEDFTGRRAVRAPNAPAMVGSDQEHADFDLHLERLAAPYMRRRMHS